MSGTLRRLVAASAIAVAGSCAAIAQHKSYMSDVPSMFPHSYALWREYLPEALAPLPEWIRDFKGTASPIRDVLLKNGRFKFGTTCKPDACKDNIAGVLFNSEGSRIGAIVKLAGRNGGPSVLVIGPMSAEEFVCVRRLLDDDQLKTC